MHSFPAPCDQAHIRAQTATSPAPGRWVLAATILGSGLLLLDGSAVNLALPAIQAEFSAGAGEVALVMSACLLLIASLLLLGGALGDRFGRRRVFSLGLGVFALSSAGCALAPSLGALIAWRAVEGAGIALLAPNSLALIGASFSGAARTRAVGTWVAGTAVFSLLGSLLGGVLIGAGAWRSVFWLGAGLGALTLLLTLARVPGDRGTGGVRGLDWGGAVLATLGLGALVLGLTRGGEGGWASGRTLLPLGVAALALLLFFRNEARVKEPLLPPTLFRSPGFSGANALTLLLYAALTGTQFYWVLNAIQVQGYTPFQAGAASLPATVAQVLLSGVVGRFSARVGPRPLLAAGSLICAAGYALLTRPGVGGPYWATFLPGLLVVGLGMTLVATPLTAAVLDGVESRFEGVASGVNNAVSRAAGLLALALFGALMLGSFGPGLERRLTAAGVPGEVRAVVLRERAQLAGLRAPEGVGGDVARRVTASVRGAYVDSFRRVAWLSAVLSVLSALVAWVWLPRGSTGEGDRP